MRVLLTEKKVKLNMKFNELLKNAKKIRLPNETFNSEIMFMSDFFYIIKETEDLRPNVTNKELKLKNIEMYCYSFVDLKKYNEVILNKNNSYELVKKTENELRKIYFSKYPFNSLNTIQLISIRNYIDSFCELLFLSFIANDIAFRMQISERQEEELNKSGFFEKEQQRIMSFAYETTKTFNKILNKIHNSEFI